MKKSEFLKSLKNVAQGNWDYLPGYYTTEVVEALDSGYLTERQLMSVILAECFSFDGTLMGAEVDKCFEYLKNKKLI
jgi:hypothetical protein